MVAASGLHTPVNFGDFNFRNYSTNLCIGHSPFPSPGGTFVGAAITAAALAAAAAAVAAVATAVAVVAATVASVMAVI